MAKVEEENRLLRRDYQLSFGPNTDNGQLRAENEHLRRKLAELSQIPQQIFAEIDELKKENQFLRGDTVRLLRKIDKF
jgi:regulator of replication initiation timing